MRNENDQRSSFRILSNSIRMATGTRVHSFSCLVFVICALEASFWIASASANSIPSAEIAPHLTHRLDNTKAIHLDPSCEAAEAAAEPEPVKALKREPPPQIHAAGSQQHEPHAGRRHQVPPQDGPTSQTSAEGGGVGPTESDSGNWMLDADWEPLSTEMELVKRMILQTDRFTLFVLGATAIYSLIVAIAVWMRTKGLMSGKSGTTINTAGVVLVLSVWAFSRIRTLDTLTPKGPLPELIVFIFNPVGFSGTVWAATLVAHFVSKLVLDESINLVFIKWSGAPLLACRDPANPSKRGLQKLSRIDYSFLALNAVIEYSFTFHVGFYVWDSPLVSWGLESLSVLNVIPAFWLTWAVNDLLYAPLHRFLHWRPVYWMVHKHHHKQTHPIRGYYDAANETPMEQVLGLSCLWITLQTVPLITGLHVVAIAPFFVLFAACHMLNHTAFDVNLWLGFPYSVSAHEMHHRLSNCNYAQNFKMWDHLMGTFKDYRA